MVVDTSALLAIAFLEPEAERFVDLLDGTDVRVISAASLLEGAIAIDHRMGTGAAEDLDDLIIKLGVEVQPVTVDQVRVARRAYRDFGRGNHPASLNFGDCFAYALAKEMGLPLLFKGNDFAQTDIIAAG